MAAVGWLCCIELTFQSDRSVLAVITKIGAFHPLIKSDGGIFYNKPVYTFTDDANRLQQAQVDYLKDEWMQVPSTDSGEALGCLHAGVAACKVGSL